jgi:hypothetical protein
MIRWKVNSFELFMALLKRVMVRELSLMAISVWRNGYLSQTMSSGAA